MKDYLALLPVVLYVFMTIISGVILLSGTPGKDEENVDLNNNEEVRNEQN